MSQPELETMVTLHLPCTLELESYMEEAPPMQTLFNTFEGHPCSSELPVVRKANRLQEKGLSTRASAGHKCGRISRPGWMVPVPVSWPSRNNERRARGGLYELISIWTGTGLTNAQERGARGRVIRVGAEMTFESRLPRRPPYRTHGTRVPLELRLGEIVSSWARAGLELSINSPVHLAMADRPRGPQWLTRPCMNQIAHTWELAIQKGGKTNETNAESEAMATRNTRLLGSGTPPRPYATRMTTQIFPTLHFAILSAMDRGRAREPRELGNGVSSKAAPDTDRISTCGLRDVVRDLRERACHVIQTANSMLTLVVVDTAATAVNNCLDLQQWHSRIGHETAQRSSPDVKS
ncbi:hypothetical protein F5148DRAFT_1368432 [Russula earlei]|uniref:Uncharacterized protein n=1 Tax=Russula earlei TaxID=71964 RepID=A0ACC0U723_9AGAM|nr:hypothetical protein F5148DRAFT_1368432 [Russula earlei]